MYRAMFEFGEVYLVEETRTAAIKTAWFLRETMGQLISLVEVNP